MMPRPQLSTRMGHGGRRTAFTLIELVAVIIVLAILSAVALPKFFNYATGARDAADNASISAVSEALATTYANHRITNAASGSWITAVAQIPAAMHGGQLPHGITINGAQLQDQRGNLYTLTAETASAAARLTGNGSAGGSSSSGSGGSSGSGSS